MRRATPNTTKANSPPCESKRGEQPALAAARCRAPRGERAEHAPLSDSEAEHQRHDQQRPVREQAEVDRHADRDEEQAQQQALERLDVGLQRVAILGAREQHAGQERAQRHRDAGRRMSCAMPITSSSANAVKTSRRPVLATMRSSGRVR